jgi:hypothetical protein
MSRRLRSTAVVAGVALASVLAACGLPQDREPQKIASPLPDNLRIRESPATSGPQRTVAQTLYFVKQGDGPDPTDMLAGVTAQVEVPSNPADRPRALLDELLKGVSADEKNENLITDIPANTQILNVTQRGQTVAVDINKLDLSGPNVRTAIAQIVFTLTSLPEVSNVQFLVNDVPIGVQLETGQSDPGVAVGRADFPAFQANVAGEPASSLGTVPG